MAFADTPASSEAPNFPYANWMNLAPHNPKTKLKDFCLPGTHDSATATLQKVWTDERAPDWLGIAGRCGQAPVAGAARMRSGNPLRHQNPALDGRASI